MPPKDPLKGKPVPVNTGTPTYPPPTKGTNGVPPNAPAVSFIPKTQQVANTPQKGPIVPLNCVQHNRPGCKCGSMIPK